MKRGFCTLWLLLLMQGALLAQSQIGLRAGANFATIQDGIDQVENIEEPWIPRLTLGLATSLWVNKAFAFAPELNYSQRGYEAQGRGGLLSSDYTYTYNYNFLELPLLARLHFGPRVLQAYLNMGPTFSYLINGTETISGGSNPGERKIDVANNSYNRLEIGGALGGGLQLNTGIGSFLIDLRYHTGFTDIQEGNYSSFYNFIGEQPDRYRTRYVSASLIVLSPRPKR